VVVKIETCGLCHTDIHAAHGDWPVKPHPSFIRRSSMVGALRNRIVSPETRRAMAPTEPSMWREVGWILRDGEIHAVERCGKQTRMRQSLA
jgi:hypothetical protein